MRGSRFAWHHPLLFTRIRNVQGKWADLRMLRSRPHHPILTIVLRSRILPLFPCKVNEKKLLKMKGLFHDFLLLRIINVLLTNKCDDSYS